MAESIWPCFWKLWILHVRVLYEYNYFTGLENNAQTLIIVIPFFKCWNYYTCIKKYASSYFLICFVMFCSIIFPSHGDVTIAKLSVVERGRVICSDSEPRFFPVSSEYPKDCPNSVPFHDKQAILRTYSNLRTCPWDQLLHNTVLTECNYSIIRGNWHVCHILTPINNSKFDFFSTCIFPKFFAS